MTSRRDFLRAGTGAGLGAVLGVQPLSGAPAVHTRRRVDPTCVASGNGLEAVRIALDALGRGETTVEAVVSSTRQVSSLRWTAARPSAVR